MSRVTTTVFIAGGSGLVGRCLLEKCNEHKICAKGTHYSSKKQFETIMMDVTNLQQSLRKIRRFSPDIIINCAGVGAERCEESRDLGWDINAKGSRNLSTISDEVDSRYVYISTNHVFPGDPDEAPYSESDPISPINFYGRTKYAGEQAARMAKNSIIIRTAQVYSMDKKNLLTLCRDKIKEGEHFHVDEEVTSPTYAPDLAEEIINIAFNQSSGLYHVAPNSTLSKYDLVRLFCGIFRYETDRLIKSTPEKIGLTAQRPQNSSITSNHYESAVREPKEVFESLCRFS